MELFITWCHLLNEVVSDGVAAGDLRQELGVVGVHVLYDRFFAWLVVHYGCADVTLQGQGHGEGGSLRLSWVVSVKLLNLDFLLVSVGVIEDDNLHCALVRCWILEVHGEATLAQFILRLLPGLLKLCCQLLEVGGWWSLCALLCNFVGGTWGLDLEVDLLVLIFLVLWLKDTFVPHFFLVLLLFLLGSKLLFLGFFAEFLVIFRVLLFGLNICL